MAQNFKNHNLVITQTLRPALVNALPDPHDLL